MLAKSTRRDPADLPAEPERLLDSPTYEGFPIRPLYTSLDALPEPTLPGQWPYVRGGDALRDVKSGWRVAEAFPANGSAAAEANGALLLALTEGASALVLRVGGAAAELDRLLEGVFLDLVPVVLDAGADYVAAADAVLALLTDLDDDQRSRLSVDLGADPLTAPLSARSAPSVADVVAVAAKVTGYDGGVRAITVDGPAFHDLGANASWELAGSIAAAVAYLRLLGEGGIAAGDALRQISFRFAADDDQFMTIAKLRAARQLWARVAEVVGEPNAGAARLHSVTSLPMMAQRDPWVNMLRTTLAAFSAGRRRRRHRAGSPVRCGHSRRLPRYRCEFRAAHCPQHATAASGGVAHRPGARPRRRLVVRRGPHQSVGRAGVEALPGHRIPRRLRGRPRLRRSARSPRWPTAAPTTSRTGARRSPV